MRNAISLVLILLVCSVCFCSCIKNNTLVRTCPLQTTTAAVAEVAALKAYIDSNHIVATQDSRGFFYSTDFSASTDTAHPATCSAVTVAYTGSFLNGAVFDSASVDRPVSLNLSGTITGWQEAIPLLKMKAKMILYLPPSLAYGASGYSTIPGNSYLVFKINLLAFN